MTDSDSKPIISAMLALVAFLMTGCQSHTVEITVDGSHSQWFLQSYDAKTGYVFERNGVGYRTHCIGLITAEAIQTLPPDSTVGSPSDGATYDEGRCGEVLPYLHRTIPLQQGGRFEKDILVFPVAEDGSFKDGALQFVIVEAK